MNFGMLKNMVENLVSSYKCPFCSSTNIDEKNIDIVGAAGNTVNIDMHCPSCNKHFMAKTEVMQMELGNMSSEKIAQIQKWLLALKGKLWGNIDIEVQTWEAEKSLWNNIKEENILDLRKELQKGDFSAKDLFDDISKND